MTEKIKGEFLKIEKRGDDYWLEYIRENGKLAGIKMPNSYMTVQAERAEAEIKALKFKLENTKDQERIDDLKYRIEGLWTLIALWPKIYVAYCKGEDLTQFFEITKSINEKEVFGIPNTIIDSASDENDKELIRTISAKKSEEEIISELSNVFNGKPEQEAIRKVWKRFRILCEVHTGDFYQTFSLQRKGHRARIEEWIKKEFGDEPVQQTLLDKELWEANKWDVPNRESWYDGGFPTMRQIMRLSNEDLQKYIY